MTKKIIEQRKTKRLIKAIILSIAFSIFLIQSAFAQYLPTVINPASIININPQLNQYIRVGTTGYRYDANGNMILEGSQQYVYDEEDRLTSTINGNQVAVYEYNGLDQRYSQTINGDYTRFIYDGDRIVEEYDAQNQNTASYIYGPGIDEVLLMVRGGNEYYYIYDGQGSVAQLIDERNTTLETYIYDAYGNPNQPSQHGNPYLFTGRRYDATSNLYHYRARAYDPTLGRFLQRDPLGFVDSMNLYSYVVNNPTNYIDPMGTNFWVVNLVKGGMKVGKKVSYETAVRLRKLGQNILSSTQQGARKVQKSASAGSKGNKGFKKHPGHHLKDSSGKPLFDKNGNPITGRSHFQDSAMAGHTFWSGAGAFMLNLLDPFAPDALANEDEDLDGNGVPDWMDEYNQSLEPCKK